MGANLLDRHRKRRDLLFVFLERADVPIDNNARKRALRLSVIQRKVTDSFRSDWCSQTYAVLTTVLTTENATAGTLFKNWCSSWVRRFCLSCFNQISREQLRINLSCMQFGASKAEN